MSYTFKILCASLAVLAFGGVALLLSAAEPAKENAPSEKEIRKLIGELAAGRAAPRKPTEISFGKPAEAWKKLNSLGPQAFPILIEYFDDERYSMTSEISVTYNISVGHAAFSILRCHIEPLHTSTRPYRSYLGRLGLFKSKDAAAWWAMNKDKPLRELQITALQWTIDEMAKETNLATKREVLQEKLEKLKADDKPLPPAKWCFGGL